MPVYSRSGSTPSPTEAYSLRNSSMARAPPPHAHHLDPPWLSSELSVCFWWLEALGPSVPAFSPVKTVTAHGKTLILLEVPFNGLGPHNQQQQQGPTFTLLLSILKSCGPTIRVLKPTYKVISKAHLPFVHNLNGGPTPLTAQPRPNCLILVAKKIIKQRPFPYLHSHTLCRFMDTIDRGRHLEHNSPLFLVWYKDFLGTLPLKSPRDIFHEFKRLKKNGIMAPSPRSGGYRSFFNPFSPFPLNTDFKQVHLINSKVIIHEIESLRKNGIMIPYPRNGGYRSFLNFLSPSPSDHRTVNTHLLADEQFQLALLAPTRTSDMEPSSTSPRLLTVTNLSSIDSFVEDH
ncbi:hypothetical protein ARALYDRAFT_351421 [Arabidopsis lyrata subsp. lyrata]|uniref:Uncharacterized protein n=1 Tax=Arabidopsis lyrata subsp. lyrata TaxID=81972 RepID=D7M2G2_ARALL|nr:hypothetical protein ARALYDRAFT_351421 [Arabidopsis lyrata subsp. lyrata]